MAASTRKQRVRALDEGAYVRYDERTSTMLGEIAQTLIEAITVIFAACGKPPDAILRANANSLIDSRESEKSR